MPRDRFADRTTAGERLAAALVERGVAADLVLAVPRGGLPLGRAVADALDAPLDVVVAKKIGAPGSPEYALGAAAADGSVWRTEASRATDDEAFERRRTEAVAAARATAERYRGDRASPDVAGERVVVVDDGVATGATLRACLAQVRAGGAARVVAAVPVGPRETVRALEADADEVVCLRTPRWFGAVGAFYDDFSQVSDDEARAYLDSR